MAKAQLVLRLCDRWHKLPSEIMAEDASMIRMLIIESMAPQEQAEEGGNQWQT